MRTKLLMMFAGAMVVAGVFTVIAAQGPRANGDLMSRVQALEDREAIRALWADYGRTLDARDFAAFSRLFARDAEFVGGPGSPARGPAAIGAFLEKAIGTNYPDSRGRNFHLYFNASMNVQGDRGTGLSKGGFVMASSDNSKADFLLLATYRDEFVREDGTWKFKRREIVGDIPVPRRP